VQASSRTLHGTNKAGGVRQGYDVCMVTSNSQGFELSPQVITANPLGSAQLASPSTVLEGTDLLQQQHSSLGETLNRQPGVASTWFGPGASRPIIRGLDGDRIRLLRNGVGALDASSLSYDHAVPLDPVTVERIEIVRGPAALLYGGNAIGGVVNTFDNRIPDTPIDGIQGAGELRYGGADTTRSSAGKLEAGNGAFALHVDANARQYNDLRIPGFARVMTPTTVRWLSPAFGWTWSRTTMPSPRSFATWTARSAR